jgi:hypothetical protein
MAGTGDRTAVAGALPPICRLLLAVGLPTKDVAKKYCQEIKITTESATA